MSAPQRTAGRRNSDPLTGGGDDWRTGAACSGQDPELWFPATRPGHRWTTPSPTYRRQAETAKTICRACPAAEPCLQWALDTGQDHGVWGGLDEYERRALRRRPDGRWRPTPGPACGSIAAARAHRYRRQPLDDACRMAEALYRAQLGTRKETPA